MVLKGAALYLDVYNEPDERPMADIDVLIRPADVERAMPLLESLGLHRGQPAFREDFFPKYYYEVEYRVGLLSAFEIDVHVRPFRVMRYSRTMPDEAFWDRATPVQFGEATVLVPSAEDMLIHLAVHSAIHGNLDPRWLTDIEKFCSDRDLDWEQLLDRVRRWRLSVAVSSAFDAVAEHAGPVCPASVTDRLRNHPRTWRDRLALWHAPRDREHLARSVLVNLLTTPGRRFRLGYLRDVLIPDREYLGEWSTRKGAKGPAWLMRCLWPVLSRLPFVGGVGDAVETRESPIHGLGVFAVRDVRAGEVMASYRGRPVDRNGTYVSMHTDRWGRPRHHEIVGPLKYLNHSCRPTATLHNFKLKALVPHRTDQEVTIDYGDGTCDCRRGESDD
jgi:hypothetical protein